MRVGVIFTGGTIGSEVDQTGYIATKGQAPFLLLEMYKKQVCETVEFVTRQPYKILSENLSANELMNLIQEIKSVIEEDCVDGIVVTHGTDTLQYSAAILSYVFAWSKIPIVLVSSNYILEDERANGFTNFRFAMDFIKGGHGTGVYVSYCNQGDVPHIHMGHLLQSPLSYTDDVYSIEDAYYGKYVKKDLNYEFVKNTNYKKLELEEMFSSEESVCLTDCSAQILQIHPYVGMKYPQLSSQVRIIIHGSYHSGTIAISEDLKNFAKKAQEIGIPFYLVGVDSSKKAYETVREYEQLGIVMLPDSAFIAQYCKAWLALSNEKMISQHFVQK